MSDTDEFRSVPDIGDYDDECLTCENEKDELELQIATLTAKLKAAEEALDAIQGMSVDMGDYTWVPTDKFEAALEAIRSGK